MRLCFLASAQSIHSYRWVRYFAERGHEVYWLSLDATIFDKIGGVEFCYTQSRTKLLSMLRGFLQLRRVLKSFRPHILHVHYAGRNGLVGALTGFHPWILTAWGSDVLIAGKRKLSAPLVKFALNRADLITCDADHMRKAIEQSGVPSARIQLIYFGTDVEMFHSAKRNEELRRKLGLQDQSAVVISLRSLEPIYDVQTLILAIPYVVRDVPNTCFIIVGDGSQKQSLRTLAESLGILDKIIFTGFLPIEEIPQYLASADVYVSTSLSDAGLAASTAEAMACTVPVIVTDSGENRLWVEDGKSGFVIPPRDPQVLAVRILDLLKSPETRAKFGAAGRRVICERNNYYSEMTKMEKLYEEVLR